MCLRFDLGVNSEDYILWLKCLFIFCGAFSFVYWFVCCPLFFSHFHDNRAPDDHSWPTWISLIVAFVIWSFVMLTALFMWCCLRNRKTKRARGLEEIKILKNKELIKNSQILSSSVKRKLGISEDDVTQTKQQVTVVKKVASKQVQTEEQDVDFHSINLNTEEEPYEKIKIEVELHKEEDGAAEDAKSGHFLFSRLSSKRRKRPSLEITTTEITLLPDYSQEESKKVISRLVATDTKNEASPELRVYEDGDAEEKKERRRSSFNEFLHLVQIESPGSPDDAPDMLPSELPSEVTSSYPVTPCPSPQNPTSRSPTPPLPPRSPKGPPSPKRPPPPTPRDVTPPLPPRGIKKITPEYLEILDDPPENSHLYCNSPTSPRDVFFTELIEAANKADERKKRVSCFEFPTGTTKPTLEKQLSNLEDKPWFNIKQSETEKLISEERSSDTDYEIVDEEDAEKAKEKNPDKKKEARRRKERVYSDQDIESALGTEAEQKNCDSDQEHDTKASLSDEDLVSIQNSSESGDDMRVVRTRERRFSELDDEGGEEEKQQLLPKGGDEYLGRKETKELKEHGGDSEEEATSEEKGNAKKRPPSKEESLLRGESRFYLGDIGRQDSIRSEVLIPVNDEGRIVGTPIAMGQFQVLRDKT